MYLLLKRKAEAQISENVNMLKAKKCLSICLNITTRSNFLLEPITKETCLVKIEN